MSYVLYAWLASIAYGLGGVFGKIATKYHIKNPWLYNIIWAILTFVFIVPFALIGHVGLPQDWTSILLLGIVSAISSVTFTFAFYAVDLSVLSPLANMRAPVTALFGVLLFHEQLSLVKWLLIGLLFITGLFIQADEKMRIKSFLSKSTVIVFIWIVTSVCFNTMIKFASAHNGYWEVSLWSNLLTVIFLLPTIPLFIKDIHKISLKSYSGITVNTLLWTAGLLFSIKALAVNVSISVAIMSVPLSMIFVMVLAFIKPKLLEKHPIKVYIVRVTAAVVMLIAALGLSS